MRDTSYITISYDIAGDNGHARVWLQKKKPKVGNSYASRSCPFFLFSFFFLSALRLGRLLACNLPFIALFVG